DKPQPEFLQSTIAISLWDVWARMKKITTEAWQLKFRNTISLYFDACLVNAQNEHTNNIPNSVDAYIKIRRNSEAVMTSFNLIEPLLGIQVLYDNQDLQNLMDYLDLINKRMTQIQDISNRLTHFGSKVDQNISKCVNALLDIVVGAFYWHKLS
ncbi:18512_t:CDS:2, partial [Racocetra fulgida]